ncbi:MAG: hypothetical protein U5K79_08475 [Cyclobacteriaceae bacterium]|nr:hypothetical protein [Cyclobacteriaceae bacterium]
MVVLSSNTRTFVERPASGGTIPNGTVLRLSIDKEGFFDLNELERLLQEYNIEKKHGTKRIGLVAVNGASKCFNGSI